MLAQLHCKSYFSFLEGASSVEALVGQAARAGVRHLALTDRDGVYGAVEFARRAEAAGIHPVVGAEIPAAGGERAVVLCRDAEGYAALCRELTRMHLGDWNPGQQAGDAGPWLGDPGVPGSGPDGEYGDSGGWNRAGEFPDREPRVPRDGTTEIASACGFPSPRAAGPLPDLAALSENNWLLIASPALLSDALRRGHHPHLAAELADHGRPGDRARNRALLELARCHQLRAVATNAAVFATPGEFETHRLLTAIRRRSTLGKLGPDDTAPPEAWLKGTAEMERLFRDAPEAVADAEAVAETCEFRFTTGGMLHPPFPVPPGETAYSLLWKTAFAGAARRYRPLTPAVIARLEHELTVINQMGYAEYFLIVRDIVEFAEARGIPTVGRGSAAGSLVAHALGVTHVDPLALNLSFERFLNTARTDPPDVDLDFCWRRRGEVIRYLYQKYGEDNAAMMATFVTMAGRGALRESARAIGLPEAEISRFTRHIPHHDAARIDVVLREIPECRNIPFDREPYATIIRLAKRIAGFPRHLGLHPCGIVLSRVPLHRVVPLQMTASGLPATQFDMHGAEDVGLLKIDILGQRSLTVIADTIAAVRERHGVSVDFSHSPETDPATWRVIQAGRTMGCFQIESPGMRSLLKKLTPRDMETIIAASSVIRPGPSDAGMLREFIARYHGRKPVTHLHPALAGVLGTTFGIMVYQEDILRVAGAVAGITADEADKLRRAMSSKRSAEAMQSMRGAFVAKAEARGAAPATAAAIWGQMETFSGYAFCKAHSSSYAVLSWQAAWLKAHYPAEFFAAVLSNGGGFYHPAAYVLEARRWGIPVLLPDVNRSEYGYTAEGASVRMGFCQVKGLGRAVAERIVAARREGPFTSFTDFLARSGAEREDAERLIGCGALDRFEFTRPELLWRLELLLEPVRRARKQPSSVPGLPFGETIALISPAGIVPRLPDYSPEEKLRRELELLDLCVSDHPLALHRDALARLSRDRAADLPRKTGQRVRLAGWLITTRRVFTRNKKYMKFMTLEDETDIFEAVLFPEAYDRWGQFTAGPGAYVVEGVAADEFGSVTVEAHRVLPLGRYTAENHEEASQKRREKVNG